MPLFGFRIPTRRSKLDLRKVQSTGNIGTPIMMRRPLHPEPQVERAAERDSQSASSSSSNEDTAEMDLAERLKSISANDLELLLSMETQARMDHLEERQDREQRMSASGISTATTTASAGMATPRPSRLKFELPATPVRPKSPPPATLVPTKRWSYGEEPPRIEPILSKKKESRWGRIRLGSHESAIADHSRHACSRTDILHPGTRVRLIRRPLLTMGYVRYVGFVDFAPGEWIGVELDRRVGKNDGSVDGSRYFQTDPHRGEFVTREELIGV